MSLGTLALIGLCGLVGPLLSMAGRGQIPAVLGEIAAGVVIGRTGFGVLDTTDPILSFLSDIGFLMLMFEVGMSVPVRDPSVRRSVGGGAARAALVAVLAVPASLLLVQLPGVAHPAVYAVIIASSSAAVVLPIVQERGLSGPEVLSVVAQVTVADIGATLAIPFVLHPGAAGRAVVGAIAVAGALVVIFLLARRLSPLPQVHTFRAEGKRRRWAIDLRLALIVLFGLAWIAQKTGSSLLIAGFGAGIMVALIGGPKRLTTEVLGIGGGFFVPLFFVVLGARIDLRGLVQHVAVLELALALAGLSILAHVLIAAATRQHLGSGLLSTAQLGVPAAIVALGLSARVISSDQAGAIIAAAVISVVACAVGAALVARRRAPASS